MEIASLFGELLQVSLGTRESLSRSPSPKEWRLLFDIAKKQTIAGVIFSSLESLHNQGITPPLDILYEWIGLSEQIKQQNRLLNFRCVELSDFFRERGWESCILKGQGNAAKYDEPLLRMPGDVDIWVNAPQNDIISFVRRLFPDAVAASHHIEYPVYGDVEVEIHYTPFYSIKGGYKKRFSRYIEENRAEQFNNPIILQGNDLPINIPTNDFNNIHQLAHLQKHFFYGGVGLRHIVDYYYLLKEEAGKINNQAPILAELGLLSLSKAVMWVLKEYLGMAEHFLLTECDGRRGAILLNEILEGGNFGKYDERRFLGIRKCSSTLSLIIRNARMFWLFPKEVISAPISLLIRNR